MPPGHVLDWCWGSVLVTAAFPRACRTPVYDSLVGRLAGLGDGLDTSDVLRWKLDLMGLRGARRSLYRLVFWRLYARRGGHHVDAELARMALVSGRQPSLLNGSPHLVHKLFEAILAGNGPATPARPARRGRRTRRKPNVRRPGRIIDTVRVR